MKHHHNHTALLVIACSTMILVYSVYGYMRHRITASLGRVIEGKHLVAERDLSAQKQDSLALLYSESADDRSKIKKLFVPEDSTVSFIESIEALGQSSGAEIELSGIEAQPPAEGSRVGRIRVRVEARGSWAAAVKTIMLAESLPYGVSLSDVRIDASQASSAKDASRWRTTFTIEALMTMRSTASQP